MFYHFEQPEKTSGLRSAAVLESYSPHDLRNIEVTVDPYDLVIITFRGPDNQLFKGVCGAHYSTHYNPERADTTLMLDEASQFCEEVDPEAAVCFTEGSVPELTPEAEPLLLLQHHMRHEKAAIVGIANARGIESRIGDGDDASRAWKMAEDCGFSVRDWIMLNLFRECTSYNPEHGLSFKEHITRTVTNRYGESLHALTRYLWGGFDFSFDALSRHYEDMTGRPFTAQERNFCLDQIERPLHVPPPPHLRTPMQNLALADADNRHSFMRKNFQIFWRNGKSILTCFGKPHLATLIEIAMEMRDHAEVQAIAKPLVRTTLVPEYATAQQLAILPPKEESVTANTINWWP